MKKLLALFLMSLVIICAFAGCGATEEVVNDAETMASDMMDGAETMVSDAVDGAKRMIGGEQSRNNGEVTDHDGFIREDDGNQRETMKETETTKRRVTNKSTSETRGAAIENNTNNSTAFGEDIRDSIV